ncbi:Kiwa anti-phage protein KwaB-like domain-containing protein [Leclercia adecarboxylata]|uniref:Kiwa anti-phage protein KwaB-like domain-containing protein n=1 Tax=Leclercia adecarboxylata TaxID=83655 RepID=UPI00254ECCB3|nr:Kiwa anti-phage protein KwaB-like domain-containing protein [Leclercia adecarboxylata]
MELFAITDSSIPRRIVKIDIDALAQPVVEEIFLNQEANFYGDDDEEVEFCASYSVRDNEYFVINGFDDEIGVLNAIQTPDAIPVWDPQEISVHYFKAIFSGIPEHDNHPAKVLIQAFDRRQIINNERSLFQMVTQPNNRFSVSNRPGFSLSDRLTALLIGEKLIFKSFFMLRRFFNMEEYFNEATREDLASFISNDIFEVNNQDNFIENADSSIKKKVSLIMSSGILEDHTIDKLKDCADNIGYQLHISENNGSRKIIMPSQKKDIKQLLYFLDQGVFNSIITNELMLTNSKRPYRYR